MLSLKELRDKELALSQREIELMNKEKDLELQRARQTTTMLDHTSMTQLIPQITSAMLGDNGIHDKIASKIAEKFKVPTSAHVCPFNEETVASLKDLGYYFSTAQKAFKGFIVLCIIVGAAAAFLIGVWAKVREFMESIHLIK